MARTLFQLSSIPVDFNNSDPEYFSQKVKELRAKHEVSRVATKEDIKSLGQFYKGSIELGETITSDPPLSNDLYEAFELFKFYYAYRFFLELVVSFLEKNLGKWNKRSIEFELNRLSSFIDATESIEPSEAFKKGSFATDEEEYVKLRDGYYEVNLVTTLDKYHVYAKYFLLYALLKVKKSQFEEANRKSKTVGTKNNLDSLVWEFEAYLENVSWCKKDEQFKKLNSKITNKQMYNVGHRALQELKEMSASGNPNFETHARYRLNEVEKLLQKRKKVIKSWDPRELPRNGNMRRFLDITQTLCNFYDKVTVLVGKPPEMANTQRSLPQMARIEGEINGEIIPDKETGELEEKPLENDLLRSTIEDYLAPFKEDKVLVNDSYEGLVKSLLQYIETGAFPSDIESIKVGRTNKKRLGWAINRLLKGEGIGIEYELLSFAKQKISIYSGYELEKKGFRKSNLYKSFVTRIE